MNDEHDQSDELSLQTGDAIITEEELGDLVKPEVVDVPDKGEMAHPEPHEHPTLKDIEAREG